MFINKIGKIYNKPVADSVNKGWIKNWEKRSNINCSLIPK
jgi:hypothetical protein